MNEPSDVAPDRDAELRRILDDVAAGRLSVDEAHDRIRRLPMIGSQAQAVATLLGPLVRNQRRASSIGSVIAGVIMCVFGGIFVAVGLFAGSKTIALWNGSAKAPGVVKKLLAAGKGTKPVVEYTVNGQLFEITGGTSTSPSAFDVGEQVTVVYRIADPGDAIIDSFTERWFFVIFVGIGAVVGLGGLGLVLKQVLAVVFRPRPIDETDRFAIE